MMRVRETVNAFSGNPIVSFKRESEELYPWLSTSEAASKVKVLPFCDGKPLVSTSSVGSPWRLAWQALEDIHYYEDEGEDRNSHLVYLGDSGGVSYFAIGVPRGTDEIKRLAEAFGQPGLTFFDVRSLMQAAEYGEGEIMGELSIAGHARAMLEWHKQASYCGRCGSSTRPILCGQRRQCTNVKCNNKLYPRIDPVVIMLVIDKERDCAILGRQSRFLRQMWSCLAGFIEPGESLEEAVRRETREEVGLEVGDIVYHSSQPWPVGPSSMSCQLMVGFFAYAKTFDIRVDKKELEDAQWLRREDVRKLLQNTRYKRDQQETIVKIQNAASGESGTKQLLKTPSDAKETIEMAFVPGPYAIAHHLISTWANEGPCAPILRIIKQKMVTGRVPELLQPFMLGTEFLPFTEVLGDTKKAPKPKNPPAKVLAAATQEKVSPDDASGGIESTSRLGLGPRWFPDGARRHFSLCKRFLSSPTASLSYLAS